MKARFASSAHWLPFFAPEDGTGGAGGAPANAAYLATLPETIRGHEAFKDVKDGNDLATRYHGELTRPFAERLPEDIRTLPTFKDYKDLAGLARSHANVEKLVGAPKERVLLLPEGDDEKEWGTVYGRLGRPEAADKYEVKYPDGYNESDGDKAFKSHMLPVMHKYGLSQRQLAGILSEGWMPYQQKVSGDAKTMFDQRRATATEGLKKDWGTAFDQNLADGDGALGFYETQLKLPGLAKEVTDAGLHHSPNMIKFLSHIGKTLREDGKLQGGGGGGGNADVLSPVEAQQQINALRSDAKFMADYNETAKSGPRLEAHNLAVKRMQLLYEQGHPQQ